MNEKKFQEVKRADLVEGVEYVLDYKGKQKGIFRGRMDNMILFERTKGELFGSNSDGLIPFDMNINDNFLIEII